MGGRCMRQLRPPPTTRRARHAAWDTIRRVRGLGIELKADLEYNRVRFRPKDAMTLDLLRELHEYKAAVLLILDALDTVISPDAKPAPREPCRFCGARVWLCTASVYQCGKCHALWRPQSAKVTTHAPAREQGA
jgi:hypothetical protein